jgi:REP element-mobilizing transposase RayT
VGRPCPKVALSKGAFVPKAPNQDSGIKMTEQNLQINQRKKLSHWIPEWVESGAVYFITINTAERGKNQLAKDDVAKIVKESLIFYQNDKLLWINYLLLMPDHLHMLVCFNSEMIKMIRQWKRYIARETGVKWQSDFFDHRLRHNESLFEKWEYIKNNPVRKGLIKNPEDWKYQWVNGMQAWDEVEDKSRDSIEQYK